MAKTALDEKKKFEHTAYVLYVLNSYVNTIFPFTCPSLTPQGVNT